MLWFRLAPMSSRPCSEAATSRDDIAPRERWMPAQRHPEPTGPDRAQPADRRECLDPRFDGSGVQGGQDAQGRRGQRSVMNGDRIPGEGHTGPARVWILNACGYATMTGASCGIFRCRYESRKTNGLSRRAVNHARSSSRPLDLRPIPCRPNPRLTRHFEDRSLSVSYGAIIPRRALHSGFFAWSGIRRSFS